MKMNNSINSSVQLDISVIIVTWNNEKDIEECLSTILEQDFKGTYNVIVIDNASTDKTCDIITKSFPGYLRVADSNHCPLNIIRQQHNIYLTGGNNYGIRYAFEHYKPEYILCLNPDTKVEKNVLSELYKAAENDQRIGAVGPKVKFYKSKNEGKINTAGLFYDGFMQAYDVGFMMEDQGQFDESKEVWGVSGVCVLYRSEMLQQIGLYWEKRIKLHLDEVELFIRAHKAGWRTMYTPKTTVWHSYMQSTEQSKVYKIEQAKRKVWLWIALRHYPIRSKVAMIRKFVTSR